MHIDIISLKVKTKAKNTRDYQQIDGLKRNVYNASKMYHETMYFCE